MEGSYVRAKSRLAIPVEEKLSKMNTAPNDEKSKPTASAEHARSSFWVAGKDEKSKRGTRQCTKGTFAEASKRNRKRSCGRKMVGRKMGWSIVLERIR